jgi:hypothetical protein
MLKADVLALRAATRSGDVKKEEEKNFKKTIHRIEKSVQMARIKYSVVHSENSDTRRRIDDTRKDKILYLQIKNNLVRSRYFYDNTKFKLLQERDIEVLKKKIQEAHKDVGIVNDSKQRAKNEKNNIKNKMLSDMEEFARELHTAKQTISSTQEVIIETIREKMESSFATWEGSYQPKSGRTTNQSPKRLGDHSLLEGEDEDGDNDIERLLAATKAESVEALMASLNQSEEYIFRYVLTYLLWCRGFGD